MGAVGEESLRSPVLDVLTDVANVVTLAALFFDVGAVAAVLSHAVPQYHMAFAFLMLSAIADWFDGYIARKMANSRSTFIKAVGFQLDSLVDVANFAIVPSIIFVRCALRASVLFFDPNRLCEFSTTSFVLSAGYMSAVVVRLACFNVGMGGDGAHYRGYPVDTNAILMSLAGLLLPVFGPASVVAIAAVGASLLLSAVANLSLSLRVRKVGADGGPAFWSVISLLSLLALLHSAIAIAQA